MTVDDDRDDLAHHEAEIAAHETFNYVAGRYVGVSSGALLP
jgi:hypothetical protein